MTPGCSEVVVYISFAERSFWLPLAWRFSISVGTFRHDPLRR